MIAEAYNEQTGKPNNKADQEGTYLVSATLRNRLKQANKRFNANDNISEFIKEGELPKLVDELTGKFQGVLESLVIDVENAHAFEPLRRRRTPLGDPVVVQDRKSVV